MSGNGKGVSRVPFWYSGGKRRVVYVGKGLCGLRLVGFESTKRAMQPVKSVLFKANTGLKWPIFVAKRLQKGSEDI